MTRVPRRPARATRARPALTAPLLLVMVGAAMLAGCAKPPAESEPVEPEAAKPESGGPDATLFGEPIDLDAFQPPAQWNAREGKTDEEYAAWLRGWQLEQAGGMIWSALMVQFCWENACAPTEQEYEEFERGMETAKTTARAEGVDLDAEALTLSDAKLERVRTEMTALLETPDLNETQKARIEENLAQLDQFQERDKGAIQRNVARVWIRGWKFNKALYERYGGTVIWQQAGLEPLGAYQAWLEEHEQNGALRLHNPQLRERFFGYFEMPHQEVDEAMLKDMGLTHPFEQPWWTMKGRSDAAPPEAPATSP